MNAPLRADQKLVIEGSGKQTFELARTRVLIAGVVFALGFLTVGARLVDVTLLQNGREPRLASAPPAAALEMDRANIVDRNGVLLATSLSTASLYANPNLIIDARDAAAKLAAVLPDLDRGELLAKLASDRSFVWIKRNLTPRQQFEVNRLGIPALSFQREERRVYPHGALTAHIVGYTGIDNRGLAGLEQSMDEALRRAPEASAPRAKTGEALQLSLDIRLQHGLRQELQRTVAEFDALGASGIVLDARNGEILAMVSLPDFDPVDAGTAEPEQRFNRNTLGLYEMGSTFKLFTAAMALESGAVGLHDGFDATQPIKVSRFTIKDYQGKKRWLSVPEIIMYSSNIGAAKMALAVGGQRQRDYLGKLGLLKASTVELPEIATPLAPERWRDINTMTIGFGHGISVSPLHMAAGVGAIASGGVLHPVTLLKRPEGVAAPGQRVLSPQTAEQVWGLMRMVVEKGTGKTADVPGYLVGGKTGSAEKPAGKAYRKSALISSFVGAFPMNDPRYVVVVVVDEPHGTKQSHGYATGGWVAAPTVGRIVARMATLLGIKPQGDKDPAQRELLLVTVSTGGKKGAPF